MGKGWDRRPPAAAAARFLAAAVLAVPALLAGRTAPALAAPSPRDLPPPSPDEPVTPDRLAASPTGAVLLTEDFESVVFPPAGWVTFGNPAVPDSGTWNESDLAGSVRSGSKGALVRWQWFRTQDEKLQTAKIDLRGFPPQGLSLSFWYRTDPIWAGDFDFLVHASADSVSWPTQWRLTDLAETGWAWRNLVLDLESFAGGDLWVRFRYFGRNGADLSLDDVWIGYLDPSAPPDNDTCAGADADPGRFEIGPATGSFTFGGDNTLATSDYPLPDAGTSCTGSTCSGRDLAWRVRVPALHRFTATMDAFGDWDDTLFLVSDCSDPVGTCVAGDRRIPDGSTVVWDNPDGFERVLWLIASGWGASGGEFAIDGSIELPSAVAGETWGSLKSRYRLEGGR